MARLYKINGEYHTFDYLHDNLGYTMEPTESASYKSAGHNDWGTPYSGNGYCARHEYGEVNSWEFWADGIVGWYGLNALAQDAGLYPADCEDISVSNGNVVSDAVFFELLSPSLAVEETYYLIREAINLGWLSSVELSEAGWEIVVPTSAPNYILISEETGETVFSSSIPVSIIQYRTGDLLMPDTPMVLIEEV